MWKRRNILYEGIQLEATAAYTEALHASKYLDSASRWEADIYLFILLLRVAFDFHSFKCCYLFL